VQKVREAAARTQCANNLKQIGVALQKYHDSNNVLPPGMARYSYTDQYGTVTGNYNGTYWSYFILPYVEQNTLYTSIPFVQFPDWTSGAYLAAVQQPLAVFRCPASTDQMAYTTTSGGTITNRFAASYAVVGSGSVGNPASPYGAGSCPLTMDDGAWQTTGGFNGWGVYVDTAATIWARDGAFGQNTRTRLVQVTDGASNTAAACERIRLITNPALYPETDYGHGDEYGTWTLGTMWAENHVENAYSSIGIPFNYNPQTTSYVRAWASSTAGGFSSNHAGKVVGCVFLDGSVHYLSADTADTVRLALGTIRGGEVLSQP
jgi:hypothetical protein